MKSMHKLARLLMMGALMEHNMSPFSIDGSDNNLTPNDISGKSKRVIPKGCKEYFFTASGRCEYQQMNDTVWSCIATSEKKAQDKFIKWHNSQL